MATSNDGYASDSTNGEGPIMSDHQNAIDAEKLRQVADLLDAYDRMAVKYLAISKHYNFAADPDLQDIIPRAEVQNDLRMWADELDERGCICSEPAPPGGLRG